MRGGEKPPFHRHPLIALARVFGIGPHVQVRIGRACAYGRSLDAGCAAAVRDFSGRHDANQVPARLVFGVGGDGLGHAAAKRLFITERKIR